MDKMKADSVHFSPWVNEEDLIIYGETNRIGVKIQTSGSLKGLITIEGEPYYNDDILRARELSWSVEKKNILHKAAAWIKKGFIHDQLEEKLVFNLNNYIYRAQSELEKVDQLLNDKSIILFKHSVTCGISSGAKYRLESDWDGLSHDVHFYYLNLLSHRNISNAIAERYNVAHQSPQILIIRNGHLIYDT